MARRFVFTAAPPTNPVLQALYLIVGTILVIGAILMGAVILAFVVGVALVLALVVWVRVWWLRRKLRKSARHDGGAGRDPRADGGVEITEVEYHVVRESRRDED